MKLKKAHCIAWAFVRSSRSQLWTFQRTSHVNYPDVRPVGLLSRREATKPTHHRKGSVALCFPKRHDQFILGNVNVVGFLWGGNYTLCSSHEFVCFDPCIDKSGEFVSGTNTQLLRIRSVYYCLKHLAAAFGGTVTQYCVCFL